MKKIFIGSSGRVAVFSLLALILPVILFPTQALSSTVIPLGITYSRPGPPKFVDFGEVEISQTGRNVQFDISGLSSAAGGSDTDLLLFYFNTRTFIPGLSVDMTSPFGEFRYSYNSILPFFMADGGGFFDGYMDFSFIPGQVDEASFILTATRPLTVRDFLALLSPAPVNRGIYPVAVYLQHTNSALPAEFVGGVPLPGTLLLSGSGLLGLGVIRRKKFISKS